jgi:hypothetical protein
LDNVECKSYNFQETENVAKSCELSSSNETASSTDLISRQGYSYYDAEVINFRLYLFDGFIYLMGIVDGNRVE